MALAVGGFFFAFLGAVGDGTVAECAGSERNSPGGARRGDSAGPVAGGSVLDGAPVYDGGLQHAEPAGRVVLQAGRECISRLCAEPGVPRVYAA